ncbi:MAG: hypothetical protein M3T55_06695 [Pseudomonadota bacterium]|nr:hypothetical protein [Pseudomonadota bacterium]
MTKIHWATVSNTDSNKAANDSLGQTDGPETDLSGGVVLQGAGGWDGGPITANTGPGGVPDIQTTGTIVIPDHTYLKISGVVDNSGEIVLEGSHYGASLIVVGSATLTGGGRVILQTGLHPNNFIYGGTLTNVDNTIQGTGDIGNSGASGTLPLTLINGAKGVIDGYSGPDNGESGTYLLVSPNGGLTNDGTIESTGTTTGLVIRGTTVDGSGGGVILATDGSTLQIDATIAGGTLSTAGSGVIDMYSGELDGRASAVHNTTDLMLNGNPGITVLGTIANTGTITIDSGVGLFSSITVGAGGATLRGGGEVNVTGGATLASAAVSDVLTNFDNTITGTGVVGGVGGGGSISLINDAKGVIDGQAGLRLGAGNGTITNDGLIEATGTLGLTLSAGVIDGSGGGTILATDGATVILAGADIVGGTLSTTGSGVIRSNSGTLDGTKAIVHNTGALNIDPHYSLGIQGKIANTGTIGVLGGGFYDAYLVVNAAGATLTGGGQVYLGSRGLIQSAAAGDTLTNFDNTISGAGIVGANSGSGNSLTLINGAKGVIDGNTGLALRLASGTGTITNDGLIEATSAAGVVLQSGVIDGSGGGTILAADSGVVTLTSGGHVSGGTLSTAGSGIILSANGYLDGTHAAVHNTGALDVANHAGLAIKGTIDNTGVILVEGGGFYNSNLAVEGAGVTLTGGGQVILGGGRSIIYTVPGATFTNDGNTISGDGNFFYSPITVVNLAGTIDSNGASALTLPTTAGKVFINGGVLEATGTGGLIIQNATVNGTGGTIFAGAGSVVSLQSTVVRGGTSSTAAGGAINVGGGSTASLAGATVNAGTISLIGPATSLVVATNATLTGGGTVSLGTSLTNRLYGASASTTLTNVDNTISGSGFIGLGRLTLVNQAKGVIDAAGGTIVLNTAGKSLTNTGLMESTAGGHLNIQNTTIANAGGVIMAATGTTVRLQDVAVIGGTLQSAGNGLITTFDNTSLIDGTASMVSNQATVSVSDNSALTVQGMIANSGRLVVNATTNGARLTVGAAGLTLSGAGQVILSDDALNRVVGIAATATLTNIDNRISGAGQLGDGKLNLINQAKGIIDANGGAALFLNTGTNTIMNAGLIEAVGAGGATIVSAIDNSGTLEAAGGVLTAERAVTGTGSAVIASATADFLSTFSQNVTFTGTTGILELARSQSYAGSITGFSKTGGTSLDLKDIAFKNAGEATFSGTASSGTLTVTDGAHTAKITLIGDYRTSTFTASSDGHGGTTVVDPQAGAPSPLPIIAAMAGLGAGAATGPHVTLEPWRASVSILSAPRVSMA